MLQRLQLPSELEGSVWRYAEAASANRRHRHAELELNLVTRGAGTYLLGNLRYRIRRGDLLWLFPAQEHVLFEQSPDFEMWVLVFRRRALRRTVTDPAARPLLQRSLAEEACRRLVPQDLSRLEELCSELAAAADEPGLLNVGLGYALLYAWKCFSRATGVPVREVHPAVERAARLIRNQTSEGTLEQLAHEAGLSPSRLSRLFKQQTGQNLVEFRNRERLERFLYLAQQGSRQTLLELALAAGFGSYPQFHRVFQSLMGCSPADYRRAQPTPMKP